MLDKLKEQYDLLLESKEFKEFSNENVNAYLIGAFLNHQKGQEIIKEMWEINFYCPDKKNTYTFSFRDQSIKIKEDTLFQKEEKAPSKLDLDSFNIEITKALDLIEEDNKKSNRHLITSKIITIIGVRESKPIYNFTLISEQMEFINAVLDGETGEILKIEKKNLLDIGNFAKP